MVEPWLFGCYGASAPKCLGRELWSAKKQQRQTTPGDTLRFTLSVCLFHRLVTNKSALQSGHEFRGVHE